MYGVQFNKLSSTTDETTDNCAPSWAHGLRKAGLYYSGFAENIDWILEQHQKDTVTFYGTRNSTLSHYKENVQPEGNDEVLLCTTMITNVVYLLNVNAIFILSKGSIRSRLVLCFGTTLQLVLLFHLITLLSKLDTSVI